MVICVGGYRQWQKVWLLWPAHEGPGALVSGYTISGETGPGTAPEREYVQLATTVRHALAARQWVFFSAFKHAEEYIGGSL